jgi:hypothetical protein
MFGKRIGGVPYTRKMNVRNYIACISARRVILDNDDDWLTDDELISELNEASRRGIVFG